SSYADEAISKTNFATGSAIPLLEIASAATFGGEPRNDGVFVILTQSGKRESMHYYDDRFVPAKAGIKAFGNGGCAPVH
ncbi:MAG: hypothetical protein Q8O01_06635, partial [Candidatus Omnitrophota bacterium]|nr:hypothetical protein [Candidatus Omnitrophota bacterium]